MFRSPSAFLDAPEAHPASTRRDRLGSNAPDGQARLGWDMKITPPILVGEVKSKAERTLHERLKGVVLPGWVAVHSLMLAEHPYKRWGELDFLLVGPGGILALEIKGGRVACRDGTWEFTDRGGNVHRKTESPMRQASSGLMALRDWLRGQLPHPLVDRVSFGWAAVFPDIEFHETSPEWDPHCIGDTRYVGDVPHLERWLKGLADHWRLRNDMPHDLTGDDVQQLLQVIRPQFEVVPSLATTVAQAVERSNELTLNQLDVLDAALENERLLVLGGAGTGKTFVAAELARRRRAEHPDETIAICVPWPPAALPYGTANDLGADVLIGEDADPGTYDFVIMDEAQDFMTASGIEYLDRVVSGGLNAGSWAAFIDANAQRGIRRAFDQAAFDLVMESRPTRLVLRRNLRNSHEIVAYVADTTGADIGIPGGGHGPDVSLTLLEHEDDFPARARAVLEALRREAVLPRDVVVLTWLDPGTAALQIGDDPWTLRAVTKPEDLLAVDGIVRVCHPRDFQGLEANHVVIGPVPAGTSQQERSETYVGITRSRADLRFLITNEAANAILARAAREEAP